MPNPKILLGVLQEFVAALESKNQNKAAGELTPSIDALAAFIAVEENAMQDEKGAAQQAQVAAERFQRYRLLTSGAIHNLRSTSDVLKRNDQRDLHKFYVKALIALYQAKCSAKRYELIFDGSLSLQEMIALKPYLRRFQRLVISRCNIGDEGAKLIADVLADPRCEMRVLELEENNITAAGAGRLFHSMRSNAQSKLRELSLNKNPITDVAIVDLAAGLADSSIKSRRVYLAGCRIGNKGANALGECLKINKTVAEVDVSDNQDIDEQGCAVLLDALMVSQHVRTFSMRRLDKGSDRNKKIIEVVNNKLPQLAQANSALVQFNHGVKLDAKAGEAFEQMIRRNERLRMEGEAFCAAAYATLAFERVNANHKFKTSFVEPKKDPRSLVGLFLANCDVHPIRDIERASSEEVISWDKVKERIQKFSGTRFFQAETRPLPQPVAAAAAAGAAAAENPNPRHGIKRGRSESAAAEESFSSQKKESSLSQKEDASQSQQVAMDGVTQSPVPWDKPPLARRYSIPRAGWG